MRNFFTLKIVYLILSGVTVFLFFPASIVMLTSNAYIPVAIFLLIFSSVPVILSCVLLWLDLPRPAFWISLVCALVISYIGVFLLFRENAIFGIGTMCRHFFSLLLPIFIGIYRISYRMYTKKHGKVVFSKTEKDKKEKAKSILE